MGNICCDSRKKTSTDAKDSKDQNPADWNNLIESYLVKSALSSPKKPFESVSSGENHYSITYELNSVNRLTVQQRESIIKLLDSSELPDECFDGFVEGLHHLENGENVECTIGITSHSLYLLDRTNFSNIIERVLIDKLEGLLLDYILSAVLLITKTQENCLISSPRILEVVKAIEQIYIEKFDKVIPWNAEGSFSKIRQKMYMKSNLVKRNGFIWDTNLCSVLIQNAYLREKVLVMKLCLNQIEYFVMTNTAVYRFGLNFKLLNRIEIEKVLSVQFNQSASIVFVNTQNESAQWNMPQSICEDIRHRARLLKNENVIVSLL